MESTGTATPTASTSQTTTGGRIEQTNSAPPVSGVTTAAATDGSSGTDASPSSQTSADSDAHSVSGHNLATIVGGIIGGLVVFALICAMVMYFCVFRGGRIIRRPSLSRSRRNREVRKPRSDVELPVLGVHNHDVALTPDPGDETKSTETRSPSKIQLPHSNSALLRSTGSASPKMSDLLPTRLYVSALYQISRCPY